MDDQKALEQFLQLLIHEHFYKLIIFLGGLIFINWIKDFISLILSRRKLISEQIINMDSDVTINGCSGRIVKIGLTHVKLEGNDGIFFIPIDLIVNSAIVKKDFKKKEDIISEKAIQVAVKAIEAMEEKSDKKSEEKSEEKSNK